MDAVTIDRSLCIGCGECAAECVAHNIAIENGKAVVFGSRCIECGHCYAVCPTGAVEMPGYDLAGLEGALPMTAFNSDDLLLAMESRRSVRRFTQEPVSREDVMRILEAGRYSPTGSNAQGVHFVVLRDRMAEAESEAVRLFRRLKGLAGAVSSAVRNLEIDDRFFFKGAPMAIVVAGNNATDPSLASSYMELLAASLGLGVFYSGFFVYAAKHSPAIKSILNLPNGVEPVTTLVIGHSEVQYHRRAPRKPLNVQFI